METKPAQPATLKDVSAPETKPLSQSPVQSSRVKFALFRSMVGALANLGQAFRERVTQAGGAAAQTGKTVLGTATGLGTTTAKHSHRLLKQATENTGQAFTWVSESPLLRRASKAVRMDWLLGILDRVDLVKAENQVKKLQQEHPEDSPSQIAHRLMLEKAVYTGGIGLATSLVPGQAAALLTVDLATTTLLQSEMVYQIAAAYGLSLQDPARKGEILAIFGLALGGGRAIKAGLALLRNTPVAGAVIGAGANATMLYSLGYAACRFYEARLDTSVPQATLADSKTVSDNYLAAAIAQETVMDQILVHVILADHPDQSWQTILPELQALQFSPTSLEAIEQHIRSPQPLDSLLNQLNKDFAVPLLARCYKIAQLNQTSSPDEDRVLNQIASKFDISLDSIRKMALLEQRWN
ncbi:hypothetical protein [Leptolyngbya sp. FACHB-261]|uniref:hypothetical protein n=1 Tax=Leptolyngbya sp. FACHB-261 TaxID=2692806 RepID=UPI001682F8D0|nr:hypothetical protein [Leptolyngbya sp. FACHB-261]MBD2099281.1 hypothetical protein [Leptolyngbya sp. FACHB-261]